MIKRITTAALTVITVFAAVMNIYAAAPCMSWYCRRQKEHRTPQAEPEMSFVTGYGGVYTGDPDKKIIYLTFDAGYENGNIAKILDTLAAHSAKGAFFVLDNLVRRDTGLVTRMAQEGHLVCNHTAHHRDMTKADKNQFADELNAMAALYKELTGLEMASFYRPPEGKFNENNLRWAQELGYTTVFWSLAYADWDNDSQPDPEKSLQLLLDNTHNGAIVLLHPTSATNAAILDRLLTEWENAGYTFGSLEELKK